MSAASCSEVINDNMNPNRERKPSKGILKNSSSFDTVDPHPRKEMKWDEMNILATFHPSDKDYGHMKVDEPPTPYSRSFITDDDDVVEEGCQSTSSETKKRSGSFDQSAAQKLDPDTLASRLAGNHEPKVLNRRLSQSSNEEDDDSDEQKERNAEFELKRRLHYNEFHAMKLAKQLMEQEDDDEDGADRGNNENNSTSQPSTAPTDDALVPNMDVQMTSISPQSSEEVK